MSLIYQVCLACGLQELSQSDSHADRKASNFPNLRRPIAYRNPRQIELIWRQSLVGDVGGIGWYKKKRGRRASDTLPRGLARWESESTHFATRQWGTRCRSTPLLSVIIIGIIIDETEKKSSFPTWTGPLFPTGG